MSISAILAASLGQEENVVIDASVENEYAGLGLEALEEFADVSCEAEVELVQIEAAIEITQMTVASMEGIQDLLARSAEEGGLDAAGAALVAVATNAITAPFGGEAAIEMPALESFEEDGGRMTGTVAMENKALNFIKDLWASLLKMMKNARVAIGKFLDGTFSKVARLQKAADAIAAKASKAEGKPEAKSVKIGRAQYLYDGQGVSKNLAGDVSKLAKELKTLAFSKPAVEAGASLAQSIESVTSEDMSTDAVKTQLRNARDKYIDTLTAALGLQAGIKDSRLGKTYGDVKGVRLELGNGLIVVKDQEDGIAVPAVEFIVPAEAGKGFDSSIDVLTMDEVGKVAAAVKELCGNILDARQRARQADKMSGNVEKAGKKMVGSINKDEKKAAKETLRTVLNSLGTLERNQRNLDRDIIKHGTFVAGAAYSLCVASVKNLKKEKKEEEKKDDKKEG